MPDLNGELIVKRILVIGLTIIVSVSIFVAACGAGAPPPALSSMALPQNKSPQTPVDAGTPEADTSSSIAVVPVRPENKPLLPDQDQERQVVAAVLATPVLIAEMGIEDR